MNPPERSRRIFVRLAAYSLIGGLVFFHIGDLNLAIAQKVARFTSTTMCETNNAPIGIKVVYLLMAQYIDTSQEYFTLSSPATLGDLLSEVLMKHPVLSGMLASMQLLINGSPTIQIGATLKNGDEVDFVPIVSGG